jgi:hypothetical protein
VLLAISDDKPRSGPPTSLRVLALPPEHGAWGLLVEPLLLGLTLAPTAAGFGFTLAALSAFLARHPLKLALTDVWRGSRSPRTGRAAGVGAAYAIVALAGLAEAAAQAPAAAWEPLLVAVPLGLVQLAYDVRLQGRRLLPQLLGGVALAATAPTLMVAGGLSRAHAFAAWALLAARAVTSILYVRARLRLDRDQEASRAPAVLAHAVALAGAAVLASRGLAPGLGVVAFGILFARATHGLSPWHRRVRPQRVGLAEMGYGIVTVALIAVGYLKRG